MQQDVNNQFFYLVFQFFYYPLPIYESKRISKPPSQITINPHPPNLRILSELQNPLLIRPPAIRDRGVSAEPLYQVYDKKYCDFQHCKYNKII